MISKVLDFLISGKSRLAMLVAAEIRPASDGSLILVGSPFKGLA